MDWHARELTKLADGRFASVMKHHLPYEKLPLFSDGKLIWKYHELFDCAISRKARTADFYTALELLPGFAGYTLDRFLEAHWNLRITERNGNKIVLHAETEPVHVEGVDFHRQLDFLKLTIDTDLNAVVRCEAGGWSVLEFDEHEPWLEGRMIPTRVREYSPQNELLKEVKYRPDEAAAAEFKARSSPPAHALIVPFPVPDMLEARERALAEDSPSAWFTAFLSFECEGMYGDAADALLHAVEKRPDDAFLALQLAALLPEVWGLDERGVKRRALELAKQRFEVLSQDNMNYARRLLALFCRRFPSVDGGDDDAGATLPPCKKPAF